MDERKKPPLANLSPLAFRPTLPTPGMEPPESDSGELGFRPTEPEFLSPDRTARKPLNDLPGPPRWKKILGGLFRVSTVAVPGAGAGYIAAHVQMMPQTQTHEATASLLVTRSEAGKVLDSANIDKLVPILVVIVPEDNTDAKRAETKSILEQGMQWIKSLPGDVLLDAVKDAIKVTAVGAPALALARFLKRRAGETGNRSIAWAGAAAEKIADLFGEHPITGVITSEQLGQVFGDKALAAETLLLLLGCQKRGNEWSRPS
jgi:hypothetical protein